MAEDLKMTNGADKSARYKELIPQIEALVHGEVDSIANLSNVMACLRYGIGFFWVGIYRVTDNSLVLGPFQGPPACTRITKGKGVCGTCWERGEAIIVPDVEAFPGHIACSSASKSEIVLPGFHADGSVAFVLDVDSEHLNDFDEIDSHFLKQVVKIIEGIF